MSDHENLDDETENAIIFALEAMRDSRVWRGPMRIDGSVKEFAEDVRTFVKAADDMKEGRHFVSLGTYQATTDEVTMLREHGATLTKERDTWKADSAACLQQWQTELAVMHADNAIHCETIRVLREALDDSTDLLRRITGTLAYDADIQWVHNTRALEASKHFAVKDGDG